MGLRKIKCDSVYMPSNFFTVKKFAKVIANKKNMKNYLGAVVLWTPSFELARITRGCLDDTPYS